MKSFKEMVEADLITFINKDEFAEEHEFMGKVMDVVETSDETSEAKVSKKVDLYLDGVFTTFKRINFEAGQVETPTEGDLITYDYVTHKVLSSSESAGMVTVELILTDD